MYQLYNQQLTSIPTLRRTITGTQNSNNYYNQYFHNGNIYNDGYRGNILRTSAGYNRILFQKNASPLYNPNQINQQTVTNYPYVGNTNNYNVNQQPSSQNIILSESHPNEQLINYNDLGLNKGQTNIYIKKEEKPYNIVKTTTQENNNNNQSLIEKLLRENRQNADKNNTNNLYEIKKKNDNYGYNLNNKTHNYYTKIEQTSNPNLNFVPNEGYSSKKEENHNNIIKGQQQQNKIIIANNNNNKNNNNNNNNNLNNISNTAYIQGIFSTLYPLKPIYYFHLVGLYNIGSTCYMNATLQCLLHVSPLISYFINLYLNHYSFLQKINDSPSKGNISRSFYGIIELISKTANNKEKMNKISIKINARTTIHQSNKQFGNAVSPEQFQRVVGYYNPQFRNLEANDSKDLILYLLQVMHQELNYYTKNIPSNDLPNQYNRAATFTHFNNSYDVTNFSIISLLFYGTNENMTQCSSCKLIIYNFQKFEFLSFGVRNYVNKEFNLYNGFDDYEKIEKLTGDNQYYCNYCQKLCDADIMTKIVFPPKYLLINIDYGKNKRFIPKFVKYDDEIDITKYVSFNFGKPIKYKILGVCSHSGYSGRFGHYVAFCKHKENLKWYKFNDSIVSESRKEEIIYFGDPYLLLYEKIE